MKVYKNDLYYCPLETVESHGVKGITDKRITRFNDKKYVKVRCLLTGDFEAVDVYFSMNKFPVHTSLLMAARTDKEIANSPIGEDLNIF